MRHTPTHVRAARPVTGVLEARPWRVVGGQLRLEARSSLSRAVLCEEPGKKKCRLARRTTAAPGASRRRRFPARADAPSGLARKRKGREERVRDEGHGYGFKGIGCLNDQECRQPH